MPAPMPAPFQQQQPQAPAQLAQGCPALQPSAAVSHPQAAAQSGWPQAAFLQPFAGQGTAVPYVPMQVQPAMRTGVPTLYTA